MDYGRGGAGLKLASDKDDYFPIFYLDMISIVGCPLRPITSGSGFFDNIMFILQYWQALYSFKHAISSLPFELIN